MSKVKNKACSGYIDCIKKAKDFSLISEYLGEKLIGLAKLRNLLVHRYWDIDDKLLLKEVKTHKDDLLSFVEEIENNLKNFYKEEEKMIKGKVWKFGDNVDTDVIIPARYLNTTDPEELAKHCMEDADPEFSKK